ncbi:MAG: cytochrome c oxidase subunit II, partial [Alphaproteobacteria bacterium]|nr:cytochrome c oxidase subunit II [Alphaproteobacteria bacterium]
MHHWVPFWPRTAAINGYSVDTLYIAELALCGFILATVVALMFGFCVRYRAGNAVSRA